MNDSTTASVREFMSQIGKKGGLSRSPRKRRVARKNLMKGRRLYSNRLRELAQKAAERRVERLIAKDQWRAFIV